MKTLIEKLGAKRFAALLLGPGLLVIAFDSAVAHFAGKQMDNPLQLIPLAYGAAGFIVMMLIALPKLQAGTFRRGLRVVGFAAAAVGAAGTFFHLKPLLVDLSDEPITMDTIEGALSLAPPLFAPSAFIGLGMLLWVLASPKLELKILTAQAEPKPAPAPDALPAPQHTR